LLWDAVRLAKDYPTSDKGKARNTFEIAQNHVLLHCSLPLSRKLVANAIRIHPRHLSRLFTRFAGESFAHYLQRIRFERACKLLLDSGVTIFDVAAMCGFTSANYFSRAFRAEFGMSPGAYRADMGLRAK
jgi:AraC-like DNA-binding protein